MFRILCEDLMMLRFSNTKSSMLYNLLSVDEAQMFVFEALLEKKQFNMSVPVNMSVHFYSGGSAHKEGSRKEGGAEDHLAQQCGHNNHGKQEWAGNAVPRGTSC